MFAAGMMEWVMRCPQRGRPQTIALRLGCLALLALVSFWLMHVSLAGIHGTRSAFFQVEHDAASPRIPVVMLTTRGDTVDHALLKSIPGCVAVADFGGHSDILTASDEECRRHGFMQSNFMVANRNASASRNVTAWDKALFLFRDTQAQHVWFVEDDVLILSPTVFAEVDAAYPEADLLTASHVVNTIGLNTSIVWNHWRQAVGEFPLPWASSMVCACRLSRGMLSLVHEHARANGHLSFIELMFNTLALQHGLKVETPPALRTILFPGTVWTVEVLSTDQLYHPVKGMAAQAALRGAFFNRTRNETVPLLPPTPS